MVCTCTHHTYAVLHVRHIASHAHTAWPATKRDPSDRKEREYQQPAVYTHRLPLVHVISCITCKLRAA